MVAQLPSSLREPHAVTMPHRVAGGLGFALTRCCALRDAGFPPAGAWVYPARSSRLSQANMAPKTKFVKKGVKLQAGHGVNSASCQLWKSYERFSVFEASKTGLYFSKEQSGAYELAVKGKDLSLACPWLAVCTFATPKYLKERMEPARFGPVPAPVFLNFLRHHATAQGIAYVVYKCEQTGQSVKLVKHSTVGKSGKEVKHHSLLWLTQDGNIDHVLPFAKVDLAVEAAASDLFPAAHSGARDSSECCPVAPELVKSGGVTVDATATGATVVVDEASSSSALPGLASSGTSPVDGAALKGGQTTPPQPPKDEVVPQGLHSLPPAACPDRAVAERAEEVAVCKFTACMVAEIATQTGLTQAALPPPDAPGPVEGCAARPARRRVGAAYFGCVAPPASFDWIGGWWPTTIVDHHVVPVGFAARRARDFLRRPDVILATVENVEKFGASRRYVDLSRLHIPGQLRCIDTFRLTDGVRTCELFQHGTTFATSRGEYRAVEVLEEEGYYLRLQLVSRSFGELLRVCNIFGSVAVQASSTPRLNSGESRLALAKAQWTIVQDAAADPLTVSILAQARTIAAAGEYNDDAYITARGLLSEIAGSRGMRFVGGKPFEWGYCFSCGLDLPGRFPGRLCKRCCEGTNTKVGRLVADGLEVCTLTTPIVYTGVVNTTSRHPPLKLGVRTRATEAVFRVAPSIQQSLALLFPFPGVARAWEGLD